eukprot:SAG31_NODE_595_length_13695_cov_11.446896_14_plen_34_part_00
MPGLLSELWRRELLRYAVPLMVSLAHPTVLGTG